ncbi:MAG: hypothetical protein IJJ26_02000, partial [Victivallales bacterium]|nr:hypothetical protein [Victivallales bacterium]
MKVRADELLARLGVCPSRSAAQQAIRAGQVHLADGTPVRKASHLLEDSIVLSLAAGERFVSRGAQKILATL